MNPDIWRYVFDTIEDPAFLHDAQFRVIQANRAYCRAAGVTEAQALGKPYWEVFPPGSGPLPGCKEVSVGAKLFLSKGYPIRDDQGKYLYSLHLLSDITDHKWAEAALIILQSSISELNHHAMKYHFRGRDQGTSWWMCA